MIQSNLESLPYYYFGAYALLVHLATKIGQLHRKFFWNKSNSVDGNPLITWAKFCKLKSLDGLGLRKMPYAN